MNELVNALSATKHKKLSVQSRIDILKDDNSDVFYIGNDTSENNTIAGNV